MKKFLLLTSLFLGSVLFASAKKETLSAFYFENGGYAIKYMIDREAQKFYFDSDSPDDANMLMKNYKKVGNKETFDLYPEIDPTTKLFSVELVIDPKQEIVTDLKSQTITVKQNGKVMENFAVKTQKQVDAEKAANAPKSKAAPSDKVEPAAKTQASADKVEPESKESGVKKTLNKGLSVFKKKK